jgi:MarR family transcriptional regulator, organic hydroperoxide resistance regulator
MAQSSLTRELRQTKPFPSPRDEAFVALLRTADMLRWRLSEVIEPHGITVAQFNVLRILRGAQETGLPTLEISTRMVEQAPGITRLVDRLEKAGLVRRERTRSDRRQVLCHIEPKGLKLLSWLDASVPQATEVLFSGLKPGDVEKLTETLDSIRKACAARCPSLRKH